MISERFVLAETYAKHERIAEAHLGALCSILETYKARGRDDSISGPR